MKLCDKIHQIKIDFQVTEQVKRYVYVYLIEPEACYLIDSGVYGSERVIAGYMRSIGRELSELRGIFLTHSHPDHVGAAARLKAMTGCRIYASEGERAWIENIDLEYRERPIPNFYQLAGTASVGVDQVLSHGETVSLEPNLRLEVIGTRGHSMDDLSFLLREPGVLFCGDAIPVPGDIPIYVSSRNCLESLKLLGSLSNSVRLCCPAWDVAYWGREVSQAIESGISLVGSLDYGVRSLMQENPDLTLTQYTAHLCETMQTPQFLHHPLFQRTVLSHIQR